jgi:hypothetical protein
MVGLKHTFHLVLTSARLGWGWGLILHTERLKLKEAGHMPKSRVGRWQG